MKNIILAAYLLSAPFLTKAQTDTITGDAANAIMKQLGSQLFDSTKMLSQSGKEACQCISKINTKNKDAEQVSAEISKCIHKQAESYQMMAKLMGSMAGGSKQINIYTDKDSWEYKKYYYDIERWLSDSCQSMRIAVGANNKETEYSSSDNKKARAAYSSGITALKKEDYEGGVYYFTKAVEIDSMFAFAWDNLGVCNRKLGNLDEALYAYNKSLSIDPKGRLPLENIPIVYEYKKEYDKAIQAYMNILTHYPDNPEAWYGSGRMYIVKEEYEKALENMCKAYNLYVKASSPYRVDAEKIINFIFTKFKSLGKEDKFIKILKENGINPATN